MDLSEENLEFWQYNLPPEKRTAECPEGLKILSDKDKGWIGMWEKDYETQTWDQVKDIVRTNKIDQFRRGPIDLRRYRLFMHHLSKQPGGVQAFILDERLKWDVTRAHGTTFDHVDDYKILYNDWPYGIDPRIVHLVVWTKFTLPDDPATGDMTVEIRQLIDKFVVNTFSNVVGPANVIWFRNWKTLRSVESVDHFHVMLFEPDPGFIANVTNGDRPCCSYWTED